MTRITAVTRTLAVTSSFAAFGRSGCEIVVFYRVDKMQKFLLLHTN